MNQDKQAKTSDWTEKGKARELILQAAEQVFGEAGIKGATTRQIACVAGVNETTLYRNFNSKMELLKAVVQNYVTDALNEGQPEQWTGDLHRDLTGYAERYTRFLMKREPIMRMVLAEAKHMPLDYIAMFKEATQPLTSRLIDYFESARASGQICPDLDSTQLTHAFQGLWVSFLLRENVLKMTYTEKEHIEMMVPVFVRGIQACDHGGHSS